MQIGNQALCCCVNQRHNLGGLVLFLVQTVKRMDPPVFPFFFYPLSFIIFPLLLKMPDPDSPLHSNYNYDLLFIFNSVVWMNKIQDNLIIQHKIV